MDLTLPPLSSSVQAGRRQVRRFLTDTGRLDLLDDVLFLTSELLANAVLHARTPMTLSVEPSGDGVRVAVRDGSDVLPHWAPSSPTATSGRGLPLIVRLSAAWGAEPLAGGGKRVWVQVDPTSVADDAGTPEDLLELWSDEPWPTEREPAGAVDVDLDVEVRAMLDSRAHTEDLVRDLQLTLLSVGDAVDEGKGSDQDTAAVRLARRLDTANQEFHDARRQMFDQAVGAARRHEEQVTLHLRLQRDDAARARRWLAALDEADALTEDGTLLLAPFPAAMTSFRRQYIGTLIERLGAAA